MHELVHVAVLLFTLCGAAAGGVLVLWPLVADSPLTGSAKAALVILIILGMVFLLVEWALIH